MMTMKFRNVAGSVCSCDDDDDYNGCLLSSFSSAVQVSLYHVVSLNRWPIHTFLILGK